jgi:hypothetical protein
MEEVDGGIALERAVPLSSEERVDAKDRRDALCVPLRRASRPLALTLFMVSMSRCMRGPQSVADRVGHLQAIVVGDVGQ